MLMKYHLFLVGDVKYIYYVNQMPMLSYPDIYMLNSSYAHAKKG